jgi:hypothetical protein
MSQSLHWYELEVGVGEYVPAVRVVAVPTVGVPLIVTGVVVVK